MKRNDNSRQIVLDFEHPENNYLTIEQIIEREEEEKRKVDSQFRKFCIIASLLLFVANILFI